MTRRASNGATADDELTGSETETEREDDLDPQGDEGDAFDGDFEDTVAAALDEDADEEELEDEDPDAGDDDEEDEGEEEDEDEQDDDEEAEGDEDDEDEDGQPRNEDGTFAPRDQAKAGAAGAAAGAAAGDGKGGAKPGQAAEPVWEPLGVRLGEEAVPIPEARVSRANGHVFIAMPEAQFNRFQSRLTKGVAGERYWRQLNDGLRELEALRKAPPRKSDAEIEADIILPLIKPHLAELLDEKDLAILERDVKLAKAEEAHRYAQAEAQRVAEATAPSWEEEQVGGIAEAVFEIRKNFPELQGLSDEDLDDIYQKELLPVRNALYYRNDQGTFANTQYIYDRMKARAATSGRAAGAPAAGSRATGAQRTPENPAPPAAGAKASRRDPAERFNAGVKRGARPSSTSVKRNRGTSRPAKAHHRDAARANRRSSRNEQAAAEDQYRNTARSYLNSPSLDFEEPDYGEIDE